MLFLSTPSARRATSCGPCGILIVQNFYPRPPRGGRLADVVRKYKHLEISIHALREEGDSQGLQLVKKAGGFLSTPSARRATNNYKA